MKYVIHQRHYQYNDEFFERKGRSIIAIKSFFKKEEAMRRWANLERVYAQTHYINKSSSKNYIDLNLEPLTKIIVDNDKLNYIITKLEILNLIDKNFIAKKIHKDMTRDEIWDLSEELHLVELPDNALLDVLVKCDINRYVVSQYDENETVYTLYFHDYGLSDYRGYLMYFMDSSDDCVVYEENSDLLFNHAEIIQSSSMPLVTKLSDTDLNNTLFQSLLYQYPMYFLIFEGCLYFKKFHNDVDDVAHRMKALRAINEILTYPFFEIKEFNSEQFFSESVKSQNKELLYPSNLNRFLEYIKNRKNNKSETPSSDNNI